MSGNTKSEPASADRAPLPVAALLEKESSNVLRLDAEEVEPVIAPRLAANHNETVLA